MNIKPHYLLLDGLRGAAALMVLWYHVFEGFAFAGGTAIDTFNHGHLGVDFFFMLSGFVISYAYDDRWKTTRPQGYKWGAYDRKFLQASSHPSAPNAHYGRHNRFYHVPNTRRCKMGRNRDTIRVDYCCPCAHNALYPGLSRCRLRRTRKWRNVFTQWPQLVALLRVHWEYPLCALYPPLE